MTKRNEGAVEIAKVPPKKHVQSGRPRRVAKDKLRSKVAFPSAGNTIGGAGGNFYSPQLSTDFLEMPQSIDEKRNYFRHFYTYDPFVGQAVDVHTELPLSKIRLGLPKARSRELAVKSLEFCTRWERRIGLLHRLIEIVHDYHLLGEVWVFAEDTSPDMPESITHETVQELDANGDATEKKVRYEDADARAEKWLKKHYKGWTALRVMPPEQIHMEGFPFTDEILVELIPDSKTKDIVNRAIQGDANAERIVRSMPQDVVNAIVDGGNIPLNTDPEAGSFIYCMARKKSQYELHGHSILERCLHTLVYRDKLRQAQTGIASRHMTPIRIIKAEGASSEQLDEIREQIDYAIQDPDYSIIVNYDLQWEEMGSQQRLLELSTEYEITDRQLYAGLGVTESLLSGESSYSGDRINLEVINTRYMLLREELQDMVQKNLLEPMCRRMGFIEVDEDGNEDVITPTLTFTRLALRDNSDTFDALFNLYQKGSLDVEVILELLNVDPHTTSERLKRDALGFQDSAFNEVLRGLYGEVGRALAENSDAVNKIAAVLGLKYKPKEEPPEGRF